MRPAVRRWAACSFLATASLLTAGTARAADDEDPEARSRVTRYEPIYFAVGWRERTNAKFQVSLKVRFVNPDGALARQGSLFGDLYFGYSQTSLWDLAELYDLVPTGRG